MSIINLNKLLKNDDNMKFYQHERAILEITELICQIMKNNKINKKELAIKLGRSQGHITRILNGSSDMTLRAITDIFWALNSSLCVGTEPLNPEVHSS